MRARSARRENGERRTKTRVRYPSARCAAARARSRMRSAAQLLSCSTRTAGTLRLLHPLPSRARCMTHILCCARLRACQCLLHAICQQSLVPLRSCVSAGAQRGERLAQVCHRGGHVVKGQRARSHLGAPLRLPQRRGRQPAGTGRAGHVRQLRRLQAWREQSAVCVVRVRVSARVSCMHAQAQAGSASRAWWW